MKDFGQYKLILIIAKVIKNLCQFKFLLILLFLEYLDLRFFSEDKEASCDFFGRDNIELSNGTIKMRLKKQNLLEHEYFGATISTNTCFKES